MKDIAGGRFLPEMNVLVDSSASEEMTIGGEGEPHGLIAVHKIEEKPGISGIPYQGCFSEDEGEPEASRKKEGFFRTNVVWGG